MLVRLKHREVQIEGKTYLKGQHELPDSLANHWYVEALIKSGSMTRLDEPVLEKKIETPKPTESIKTANTQPTKKRKSG